MSSKRQFNQTDRGSPSTPIAPADLPIDDQGRIYHLQCRPEHVATDILLVGDPGRARLIGSAFLTDIECEHEHRGLVTVTGTSPLTGGRATIVSPLRATVATSGMGTPSLEIVLNELVLLHEIDLETRTRKTQIPRLHVVRVGTAGALQASTTLGTPIITSYAIGLDNTGLYYDVPPPDQHCERLERELADLVQSNMRNGGRFYGRIHPYVSRAEPRMVSALMEAAERLGVETKVGLTVSACGFFAPQGRDVGRVKPTLPDLDGILAEYDPGIEGQRIENMEMESSFLCHLLGGLGHWAGVICAPIAHRREGTFLTNYQDAVEKAISVALLALAIARQTSLEE